MFSTLRDRPLGVISLSGLIVVLGFIALLGTPINLFSRGQFPSLSVITNLADTNAQEMETLITKKVEEALGDVPGRKRTHSVSHSGESIVTLEFHLGADLSEASQEIRGRLRRLWRTLPDETRFPVINRSNPQDAPILVLAVTSDKGPSVAANWARSYLKPELSRINGVASVRIAGAPEKEVMVECDPAKLLGLKVTIQGVASAITRGFSQTPGGSLNVDGMRVALRTYTRLTPESILDQPIMVTERGSVITVGDVGEVQIKDQGQEEITRYNGSQLVTAAVFKVASYDLRSVWKDLRHWLETHETGTGIPKVSIIFNQAQELETSLNRLIKIFPITLFGTAVVIYFFLGSFSLTLMILTAAPFALMSAVLVLRLADVHLDVMSVAGLVLGLGVFVDHSIVVTESIYRRMQNGELPRDAIVEGVSEIAFPLLLSTIATVVVFIPLVFVSREVKLFFLSFTWSISVSLFASLIAALIQIPVLCQYVSVPSDNSRFIIDRYVDLQNIYNKLWNWGVRNPVMFALCSGAFLLIAVVAGQNLNFRPGIASEAQGFKVLIVMPPGTSKEVTDVEANLVEERVQKLTHIDRVYSETNGSQSSISVYLKPAIDSKEIQEASEQIQLFFKERPSVQFHLVNLGTEGEERTISLNLIGPGLDSLMTWVEKIRNDITKIHGVKDIIVRQGSAAPVIEFPVDHLTLGHYGVTANEVAHSLRGQLTGPVATKMIGEDEALKVRVRAKRDLSEGLLPVQRIIVPGRSGDTIPFMELAQPMGQLEHSELHRENGRPVIRLSLLTEDVDILKLAEKTEAVVTLKMAPGYDFNFGDEVKNIVRTKREMIHASILGLGLIYLILVAATESLLKPVVVLMAVPFAIAGAVLTLFLSHTPVTMPVYIGLIMLSGLVLNANIVMIYTINDFERSGLGTDDAITAGVRRRLRPILMTVFCAICGSMPMVFDRGTGSNMWGPFATTLAAGMAASCIFTLLSTPLLLVGLNRIQKLIRKESTQ